MTMNRGPPRQILLPGNKQNGLTRPFDNHDLFALPIMLKIDEWLYNYDLPITNILCIALWRSSYFYTTFKQEGGPANSSQKVNR